MCKPPQSSTVGWLEPPPASRSRTATTQTWSAAAPRGPPSSTTLPPHDHPADPGFQKPEAPQEAACGVLPGSDTPGSTHHHGEKTIHSRLLADTRLTLLSFCATSVPAGITLLPSSFVWMSQRLTGTFSGQSLLADWHASVTSPFQICASTTSG